ncbi:MAG TPA: plastocyanin/azurin family copper-binding protein [Polyangia bacterium]|nr:plastocyanin/azurin family copper-binding protein [Polyangia bacterium]
MKAIGVLLAIAAIGCSGAGGSLGTPGTGGGGGTGGSGGSGGGAFMGVPPCLTEGSYTTTGTTIQFGVNGALAYQPACLKVAAGTTVTFSGDFVTHPLQPSARRGTLTGNPITASNGLPLPDGGMSKDFTFPTPGFYAYYCAEHSDDSGTLMDGVVWVQ